MKAYIYDFNGKYSGEAQADPCQLTDKRIAAGESIERVWIFPANSTPIKPEPPKGKEAIFNGNGWDYVKIETKKEPEPEKIPEKKPEEVAREKKVLKAFEDLKKVKVDTLTLEEMRVVLGNILTLIAPSE